MVEDVITPIAGQVMTIAGMGIGVGLLAQTARNVSAMAPRGSRNLTGQSYYENIYRPPRNKMSYHPRAAYRMKPFKPLVNRKLSYKPYW